MVKITSIIIVLTLFLLTCVSFVNAENDFSIIYVDDDGEADFTTIRGAIHAASNGDTIYVHSGLYYGDIIIDKTIHLVGEDKTSTIIDGRNQGHVLTIVKNNVTIEQFSIMNCKDDYDFSAVKIDSNYNTILDCNIYDNYWGILCKGDYNHIGDNNLFNNGCGIVLFDANQNIIMNNFISENYGGLYISNSDRNSIVNNEILNHNSKNYHGQHSPGEGITVQYSDDNIIAHNNISSNELGLMVVYSDNHTISSNNIRNNDLLGIRLDLSRNCAIYENNFIHNGRIRTMFSKMMFLGSIYGDYSILKSNNQWDRNYWGRSRLLPYIIFGGLVYDATITGFNPFIFVPFYQFDWHPAKEPYDLSTGLNN
jgi:parallel beta-helix repeat protein